MADFSREPEFPFFFRQDPPGAPGKVLKLTLSGAIAIGTLGQAGAEHRDVPHLDHLPERGQHFPAPFERAFSISSNGGTATVNAVVFDRLLRGFAKSG